MQGLRRLNETVVLVIVSEDGQGGMKYCLRLRCTCSHNPQGRREDGRVYMYKPKKKKEVEEGKRGKKGKEKVKRGIRKMKHKPTKNRRKGRLGKGKGEKEPSDHNGDEIEGRKNKRENE